ncbi:tRNA pseudouridine(13) synthase TruD [Candidatus Uabimicrobium amorphum]|uniref:tRNA pseudouridine synthase D n=1 Tax=Uabimicrobium amorphum TaxID=2596890 RepID=A0A5S9IIK0_UABAM|nr:tRNA pseudouridine(13) synthase TruD [Candidatus Uabimicrobium amorphum]BBM81710.1 tRNA pseudouridine synthase D [Candidatus Uabimicrobium amorphum]
MHSLPFLTSGLPGIGGNIKTLAEDFVVEEQLLFPLSGQGEHLYVQIEKTNITTMEAVRIICKRLGIAKSAVGYAGQKDARAVTKQYFSLYNVDESSLSKLEGKSLRVLDVDRHDKKLKLGQIRGNFFSINVHGSDGNVENARKILQRLEKNGVPNYFGLQRFGNGGNSHLLGKYLLLTQYDAFAETLFCVHSNDRQKLTTAKQFFASGNYKEAYRTMPGSFEAEKVVLSNLARGKDMKYCVERIPRKIKYFFVCAYQSYLFNRSLVQRLPQIDILFTGDLAMLHPSRSVFLVEDGEKEQTRCLRNEISPTGPMYGYKMICPLERQRAVEDQILREENLDVQLFRNYKIKGERRSYRFFIVDAQVNETLNAINVKFFLRKGCYATVVLREIMKVNSNIPE